MIDKQLPIGKALVLMGAPKNEAMCLAACVTLIGAWHSDNHKILAGAHVSNVKVLVGTCK